MKMALVKRVHKCCGFERKSYMLSRMYLNMCSKRLIRFGCFVTIENIFSTSEIKNKYFICNSIIFFLTESMLKKASSFLKKDMVDG
jgi:hypothetical protein